MMSCSVCGGSVFLNDDNEYQCYLCSRTVKNQSPQQKKSHPGLSDMVTESLRKKINKWKKRRGETI